MYKTYSIVSQTTPKSTSKRIKLPSYEQGRRHEVLTGVGTDSGSSNPPTPKFCFLLGFRSLYFENIWKSKNFVKFFEKSLKTRDFWGNAPLRIWTGGMRPPSPPPASAPMFTRKILNVPPLSRSPLPLKTFTRTTNCRQKNDQNQLDNQATIYSFLFSLPTYKRPTCPRRLFPFHPSD